MVDLREVRVDTKAIYGYATLTIVDTIFKIKGLLIATNNVEIKLAII